MITSVDRCGLCEGELLADDAYCALCGTQVAVVSTRRDSRVSTHAAQDPELGASELPRVQVPSRVAASAQGTSPSSEHAISDQPVDELTLRLEQGIRAFTEGKISATTLGRIEAELNLHGGQAEPRGEGIKQVGLVNPPEDANRSAPDLDSAVDVADRTSIHRDADTQEPVAIVELPDSQEVNQQQTPFVDAAPDPETSHPVDRAEHLDTVRSGSGPAAWGAATPERVGSSSASSTGVTPYLIGIGIVLILVLAAFLMLRAAQDNTVQPSVPIDNTPRDIPQEAPASDLFQDNTVQRGVPIDNTPRDIPQEAPASEPFVVSTYCQQGAPISQSGANFDMNDAMNSPTKYGPGRVVLVWSDGSQTSGGGSC